MQTDRKKMGIFIIIIALIIIILIIYFGFLRKSPTPAPTETPTGEVTGALPEIPQIGTTTPSDKPRNNIQYDISKEAPHQISGDDLGKISMSFAERFGSYSNHSNFSNFTDLQILMTDNMNAWAASYVADLKSQAQNNPGYSGVITTALTYEVKKFDDKAGQADIIIGTQRRNSTDAINGGAPYNQNLDLSLVKVNGEWLFDKAYWEK
ncbi:MAG: hypothetical protein WC467_03490 [Patescibacteria group bacterium]